MVELRRYAAPDPGAARRKLEADADALARHGLRPTWMVWVPTRAGWLGRERGELWVQFDRVLPPTSARSASLRGLVAPLVWKLRQLLHMQEHALSELYELEREAERQGPLPRGRARRARRQRRRVLELRRAALERLLREVERELDRLSAVAEAGGGEAAGAPHRPPDGTDPRSPPR